MASLGAGGYHQPDNRVQSRASTFRHSEPLDQPTHPTYRRRKYRPFNRSAPFLPPTRHSSIQSSSDRPDKSLRSHPVFWTVGV